MAARSVVVFVITLLLLRISGRRSFGLRTPLDNIISIILAAVLSRAIVGASPFFSMVVSRWRWHYPSRYRMAAG